MSAKIGRPVGEEREGPNGARGVKSSPRGASSILLKLSGKNHWGKSWFEKKNAGG